MLSTRSLRTSLACCLAIVEGCQSGSEAPEQRGAVDAGDSSADSSVEAASDAPPPPLDSRSRDESPADAADAGEASVDGGETSVEAGGSVEISRVVAWSVRKRLSSGAGAEVLLEEMLTDLASADPKPSRVVFLAKGAAPARSWTAPAGSYISDFCVHPSGAASVILRGAGRSISLVRLGVDLTPLATRQVHDPDIAGDPHVTDAGPLDLVANSMGLDSARIASVGEDVVATVFSSYNSVILYRASFASAAWSEPRRTLIEPPSALTPNLPIGGSFDTFGAMTAWFRCLLDSDEDGNAYVAIWANPKRIRDHVSAFHDALVPLPGNASDPLAHDSDVLLTKIDPGGARVWSRVTGTAHEDEPYALRARRGAVAVVGRARRAFGFDNTFWDAFLAVSASDGSPVASRVIALDQSSIALAVDALPGGGWVLGGSEGWTQNPDGLSVLSFGAKLLLELPSLGADPVRLLLPAGPRHNEIRTLRVDGASVAFGGHEDGPIMHTGDGDISQIHATGVFGAVPAARR